MIEREIGNVTVVDTIMGGGKTSWAIDYINRHPEENFLYITPYLVETERIQKSVNQEVKTPKNKGDGKIGDILNLLKNEDDIVSTHVLFTSLNDEHKAAIQSGNYVLFIDETLEAVAPFELTKSDDIRYLLDKGSIEIDSNGVIQWIDQDYDTQFDSIKILAKNHALFYVNKKILLWQYPPDIFRIFKKIYVMTYAFKSSTMRYYFDLVNINYNLKSVERVNDGYRLVEYCDCSKQELKTKIHIYEKSDLNDLFPQKLSALSANWFKNSENKYKIVQLKNAVYNFFRNKCNARANDLMWTSFKAKRSALRGNGYSNSFVSVNCRAMNDYSERHYLAYLANIYPHAGVSQYFIQRGYPINQDDYALSELLQWIFRSAVRNKEDIYIYIPSTRMRRLLKSWLET